MKQKFVLLLVLTLSAWSPVFSAADTPETRRKEAERYLHVSPPKALFEDMADKMAGTLPVRFFHLKASQRESLDPSAARLGPPSVENQRARDWSARFLYPAHQRRISR